MPQLVLLGTASIQEYVFRSNRLRENLGASGLVRRATSWWTEAAGRQQLAASGGRMVYQGGGNAMLLFPDATAARDAVRAWSGRMLEAAPGLRVVVASLPYTAGGLAACFDDAHRELRAEENRPARGWELGASPWTRTCPSTGWAASEKAVPIVMPEADDSVEDPEADDAAVLGPVWLSAEAQAKRKHYWAHGKERANTKYRAALGPGYRFPRDLALLGTVAGSSQVALIHADGNGIGEWIRGQVDRRSDEAFEDSLRTASKTLTALTDGVFLTLIGELKDQIERLEGDDGARLRLQGVRNGNARYFPLRPIVDDGDDLTFLCHGKLGLSLAVRYLELYEEAAKAKGLDLTACAGVLIMPQKFPFAQGYELVEDLCEAAKRRARAEGGSWLDCHVQFEGRTLSLANARARYPRWENAKGHFPRRPWCVGAHGPDWTDFAASWDQIRQWPRSEAKRLLETYSIGRDETTSAVRRLGSKRAPLVLKGESEAAFDVLELLDHYYPLGGTA